MKTATGEQVANFVRFSISEGVKEISQQMQTEEKESQ